MWQMIHLAAVCSTTLSNAAQSAQLADSAATCLCDSCLPHMLPVRLPHGAPYCRYLPLANHDALSTLLIPRVCVTAGRRG
jgi:hypothetical protein